MSASISKARCAGHILLFIGTNVFAAAKILRIKKYIKALGGVKEAVHVMWGARFSYEKMQAMGGAIAFLAAELIGVADIRKNCFK